MEPARRRRHVAFRLVASGIVVALLVRMVPWRTLADALRGFPPATFALVVAAFLGCHFFGVLKWRMVIGQSGARLPLRDAVECYGGGLFANLFLPSIVGGDVLRALLAGRKSGRMEGAILGGAADRLLDLVALGVLVLLSGVFVGLRRGGTSRTLMLLGAAVAVTVAIVMGALLVKRPLARWPAKLRRRIAQLLIALRRQVRRPSVLARSLLGGIAMQSALVGLNAVLGRALGLEASPAAWVFAWSLAKLAGLAPASFNGIGVRDGVFAVLFAPLVVALKGAPAGSVALDDLKAHALAVSFLWQGVLIVGSLLCGGVWLLLRRGAASGATELGVRHV